MTNYYKRADRGWQSFGLYLKQSVRSGL